MIQKLLHYIWLGNNKTDLTLKCIDSFHSFMSDYEIIEWNESNFDFSLLDERSMHFYNKFYSEHKYAFCSDLLRLYILKRYGGIYVDTDVEFIKKLPDKFLEHAILGRINPQNSVCNGCIWGCEPNDYLVSIMICLFSKYIKTHESTYGSKWIFNTFFKSLFSTLGDIKTSSDITEFFNYRIYPVEYFCPMNGRNGELTVTENTVSIHHFNLSWKK